MPGDRRDSRRTPVAGVRAAYEDSGGAQGELEVGDLGRGGLFLRTNTPSPIGKRIALEIRVVGESATWSALGRVVWVRAPTDGSRPAGMGVKFIDVSDETSDAISRLAMTSDGGQIAFELSAVPIVERAPVGASPPPGASAAAPFALVDVKPGRGRGSSAEGDVAIDLVTRKVDSAASLPEDDDPQSLGLPRRRLWPWLVALVLIAAAAGLYAARRRVHVALGSADDVFIPNTTGTA